jgi:hypothetical protein
MGKLSRAQFQVDRVIDIAFLKVVFLLSFGTARSEAGGAKAKEKVKFPENTFSQTTLTLPPKRVWICIDNS